MENAFRISGVSFFGHLTLSMYSRTSPQKGVAHKIVKNEPISSGDFLPNSFQDTSKELVLNDFLCMTKVFVIDSYVELILL